tara:strand:+ start:114 stop:452 length:339 start_codon:yes stop_codon:yes gene_type:complete
MLEELKIIMDGLQGVSSYAAIAAIVYIIMDFLAVVVVCMVFIMLGKYALAAFQKGTIIKYSFARATVNEEAHAALDTLIKSLRSHGAGNAYIHASDVKRLNELWLADHEGGK